MTLEKDSNNLFDTELCNYSVTKLILMISLIIKEIQARNMEIEKQLELINIAFGEITALFMSQEIKGTEIVMPIDDLKRISDKLVKDLNLNI